jgi:hypothetical protein
MKILVLAHDHESVVPSMGRDRTVGGGRQGDVADMALIYLHGIVQGLYEAAWPVFIVEDHPDTLSFVVAIDDQVGAPAAWRVNDPAALTARRQYVTAVVRQRASTCRAPTTSSPIATSWPSATPSSAARAERLYPFGRVDTK